MKLKPVILCFAGFNGQKDILLGFFHSTEFMLASLPFQAHEISFTSVGAR